MKKMLSGSVPIGLLALLSLTASATAQTQPTVSRLAPDTLRLDDLSGFSAPAPSWRVVGSAAADLSRAHRLTTGSGAGILATSGAPGQGQNLATTWDHGDLELDLQFMTARGSGPAIFLQGRYALSLRDSWGAKSPTFADAGGIAPGGTIAGEAIHGGRAPRLNASRAPGLWQDLRIVFRAPRFDLAGRKIENARFVRVILNGVVVQENVEVLGPSGTAPLAQEGARGALVLQGDQGPVAFRNLRYKRDSGERVRLSDLRYRVYEGEFASLPAPGGAPSREGPAAGLTPAVLGTLDQFASSFDGTIHVPATGTYLLDLNFIWTTPQGSTPGSAFGGGRLAINGRDVLIHQGERAVYTAEVPLQAGSHAFSLAFFKNRGNRTPAFELHVEGPGIARHLISSGDPMPVGNAPSPITMEPRDRPIVLRSFMNYGGAKRTHVASVGDPAGVHYSVDLGRGAPLYAWRGPFLETTQMWNARGEPQLAEPRGSALKLPGTPAVAVLRAPDEAWPDSVQDHAPYRFLGYSLDGEGRPAFLYRVGDIQVEERFTPAANGAGLRRELILRAPPNVEGVYVLLGVGSRVDRMPDRSFALDDHGYYVTLDSGTLAPVVRPSGSGYELLLPVRFRNGEARVSSGLLW